jgi:hypothetical protein
LGYTLTPGPEGGIILTNVLINGGAITSPVPAGSTNAVEAFPNCGGELTECFIQYGIAGEPEPQGCASIMQDEFGDFTPFNGTVTAPEMPGAHLLVFEPVESCDEPLAWGVDQLPTPMGSLSVFNPNGPEPGPEPTPAL